jgi:hypothetical protein
LIISQSEQNGEHIATKYPKERLEMPRGSTVARIPIERGQIYRLDHFKEASGLGFHAMRTARAQGLRVRYLGGKAFVLGDDFLDYVLSLDEHENGAGE